MIDAIIPWIEKAAALGATWGPLLVLFFMAVESSFIPFPSEVVMIPAGFLAARGEFLPSGQSEMAAVLAVACGITGSLLGAYVNYWLGLKLGRPFLHRYGKYFFLPEPTLNRAEEIFNRYGDLTTFICRMVPAIRQLISLPAGVSRMPFGRFTFFTGAGAGIWVVFLTVIGYYFGRHTADMTYANLVHAGAAFASKNVVWLLAGGSLLGALWWWVHRLVMGHQKA